MILLLIFVIFSCLNVWFNIDVVKLLTNFWTIAVVSIYFYSFSRTIFNTIMLFLSRCNNIIVYECNFVGKLIVEFVKQSKSKNNETKVGNARRVPITYSIDWNDVTYTYYKFYEK